jgi:hypothetical protein
MGIAGLITKAKFLLNENSGTILTGMGVSGTVATAYLSGRASFKAAHILDEAEKEFTGLEIKEGEQHTSYRKTPPVSKTTKVKLVWHLYIPPVAVGVTTIASIIMANRISSKRIAALAVASGISERALQEYKAKVVEKLGERQDQKIRDEIAQDRVNRTSGNEVVIAGDGKVLCMDGLTGRYFTSTSEQLQRAVNVINHNLNTQTSLGVSLSEFFEQVGLEPTAYSNEVGWNPDKMVELKISATVASDGRPCLVVDYDPRPFDNYWRLYD